MYNLHIYETRLCERRNDMNKIKLIPVLAIVSLLSACGDKYGISLKAPKFSSVGKEVTIETFSNDLKAKFEEMKKNENFYKGKKEISDYQGAEMSSDRVRDKKTKRESYVKSNLDTKYSYDMDSLVAQIEEKRKSVTISSSDDYDLTLTTDSDGVTVFQKISEENKEYFGVIDVKNEEADCFSIDVSMKDELEKRLESVYNSLFTSSNIKKIAYSLDEMDKDDFKYVTFYENGNTFTYVYNQKLKDSEVKDSDENVYALATGTMKMKEQITFGDGTLKIASSTLVNADTKYTVKNGSNLVGDVVKTKLTTYISAEVKNFNKALNSVNTENYFVQHAS